MIKFSRRTILATSSALTLAACSGPAPTQKIKNAGGEGMGAFTHGVASGDPTETSAIIWTRLNAEELPADTRDTDGDRGWFDVLWEVDQDADFGSLAASGTAQTHSAKDFTVKVDVVDLQPGASYYYRFRIADKISSVGRLKTLPKGSLESVRFAIVSCCNWEAGYFNVYDHIARDDGFDAVLHLGDYFYEYGTDGWGGEAGEALGRVHDPKHEIITLDDYRTRHAQYRMDANLQDMTANHPLICMWDDHESANDSWETGAENHNEGEGEWSARKAAAMQAYYEWMPIREASARPRHEMYKAYSYGDLLTLVTTETRLTARAEPIIIDDYTKDMNGAEDAAAFTNDVLYAEGRHMHGPEQMDFIVDEMVKSKAAGQPWRLLGNQVVMGKLHTADMGPYIDEDAITALEKDWPGVRDFVRNSAFGLPIYPDSWDGYPWAREQFYDCLEKAGITDMVVVTGDAHEFWVNDLTRDTGQKMGVELGATSVTSPTLVKYFGDATADYSLLVTQNNQDVRYYNALHNGYIDLTFTPRRASAKLVIVDTNLSRDYVVSDVASFDIRPSGDSLKFTAPKGLNVKQRALFAGMG